MKTLNRIALICLGLAFVAACGNKQDPVEPVKPKKEKPAPETHTLTFLIPEYPLGEGEVLPEGLKTAWKAGDKIVVHGEYAEDQVTVTLEAGDISADGKSATKTVENLRPYKREDCKSSLYAGYPAEAVDNLKHCFFYTAFKSMNTQMMAACNDGDTFQFINLSSVVTFTVNGDFDSYSFTARRDIPVNFGRFQVKITDQEVNLKQYLQNPSPTLELTDFVPDGETVNRLFIPGGMDLSGGYLLRFYKDGEALKGMKDLNEVKVNIGGTLALGDVTSKLKDAADDIDPGLATALDGSGPSNCFMITAPGMYKFKAKLGVSDEMITGGSQAELIWETVNTTEAPASRSVVKGVAFDVETDYMCFQTPTTLKPGNALIALKNAEGVILWSWHIWIPATEVTLVTETNFSAGKKVMSRNLGALVDATFDTPAPVESFGLMYQWGRKDPFPGLGELGGNTPIAVTGTQMTVKQGPVSMQETFENPTVFMYNNGDWQNDGDPSVLWLEDERTQYDPCPPGYATPYRNKSCIFWSGSSIATHAAFALNLENGSFKVGDLIFPLAGQINTSSGTPVDGGSQALIWSGHWDSGTENGYGFSSKDDEYRNRGTLRATGGSVRCVAL